MKTKQELLDFYGVEIGKRYRNKNLLDELVIFKVVGSLSDNLFIVSEDGAIKYPITWLNLITYEEMPPSILDDKEREYLQHYVMDNPAFKGKVAYITKTSLSSKATEYIEITTTKYDDDFGCFPLFKQGTMYKNMELEKQYTPQELGLEE